MNLAVVLPILAVLVLLRLLRAGVLVWVITWAVGMYVTLRYGFVTPIPDSAVNIYMSITALALFAYATSSRERLRAVVDPLVSFAGDPRYVLPLAVVALAIPSLVAWSIYRSSFQPIQPPFFGRTVHPSPPADITVHGQKST